MAETLERICDPFHKRYNVAAKKCLYKRQYTFPLTSTRREEALWLKGSATMTTIWISFLGGAGEGVCITQSETTLFKEDIDSRSSLGSKHVIQLIYFTDHNTNEES